MKHKKNGILGLAAALTTTAFAQPASAIDVSETARFDASVEKVWRVINKFDNIENWHPWFAMTTTFTEGGTYFREIETHDGAWARESLDEYSYFDKSYTYSIHAGVFPVANYTSTIQVTAEGDGAKITWSASFDAAGISDAEAEKLIIDAYQAGFSSIGTILDK